MALIFHVIDKNGEYSSQDGKVKYRKLVDGVDVCKFGKQWVVSINAMRREYGEPRI